MDTPARIGMAIISVAERAKSGQVDEPLCDLGARRIVAR